MFVELSAHIINVKAIRLIAKNVGLDKSAQIIFDPQHRLRLSPEDSEILLKAVDGKDLPIPTTEIDPFDMIKDKED